MGSSAALDTTLTPPLTPPPDFRRSDVRPEALPERVAVDDEDAVAVAGVPTCAALLGPAGLAEVWLWAAPALAA
jgi:hypothetical protein